MLFSDYIDEFEVAQKQNCEQDREAAERGQLQVGATAKRLEAWLRFSKVGSWQAEPRRGDAYGTPWLRIPMEILAVLPLWAINKPHCRLSSPRGANGSR